MDEYQKMFRLLAWILYHENINKKTKMLHKKNCYLSALILFSIHEFLLTYLWRSVWIRLLAGEVLHFDNYRNVKKPQPQLHLVIISAFYQISLTLFGLNCLCDHV